MSESKIARRYAKALLDLGKEKDIVEELFKDILFIEQVTRDNRQLAVMFKSPLLKDYVKDEVVKQVFTGKINAATLEFLRVINRKNREIFIIEIADSFIDLYKEYKNIQPAFVTTAVPMDDKSRVEVTQIVHKATGSTVELVETVDPAIIGGFILRWKDIQIDASVTSKLYSLRQEFSKNLHLNAI